MKRTFGIIHCIAECRDCKWGTESYKNGRAMAAKHARECMHRVNVEWGMGGFYDGRTEKEPDHD